MFVFKEKSGNQQVTNSSFARAGTVSAYRQWRYGDEILYRLSPQDRCLVFCKLLGVLGVPAALRNPDKMQGLDIYDFFWLLGACGASKP